ncbi:MAG: MoxR family ATPase, partial [bacterium]|nr:MoxR family ATPase [bacterium]
MNSKATPPAASRGNATPPPPAPASKAPNGAPVDVCAVAELSKRVIGNVENAIVGKRKQLVLSMVAWLSGGHILLEDVPGVAKTMLARALAKSLGCHFKRV